MKRNIFVILLMFVCFTLANAQQKIIIKLIDGTIIEKEVWEVENISFSTSTVIATPQVASAVDLGLSVKWANLNFGANSEEASGYYIGWGDVTGNNYSTNNNYFPAATPPLYITGGSYDIVHKMWGDDWRIPSAEEIKELINNCTWSYVADKKGYTITSNKNSNSIFLPLAGFRTGTDTLEVGTKGLYWSGDLSSTDAKNAVALLADNANEATADSVRYTGCTIRPVFGKYSYGSTVSSVTASSLTSTGAVVNVTFAGDYVNATEFGIRYATTESGLETGLKERSTTVGTDGTQSYNLSGLQPNTTYYYEAYVVYNGSTNAGAVNTFKTLPKFPIADAVDLGLSVKWASWNMGASSAYDYGSYIAWGDPTGENDSYVNATYENSLNNIGGTDYDVAHKQWGTKWRMPTPAELVELGTLEKTAVTQNGVKGFQVTGKNGNTIFLPLGGYENATGIKNQGDYAYYWSSQKGSGIDFAVYSSVGVLSASSVEGQLLLHMLIRPVYDDGGSQEAKLDTTAAGKAATSVDLGLSVKWATYNIGSTSPTDAGGYFAWGETEPKTSFSKDNYAYYDNTSNTYTSIGTEISNTEYDAARKQWGGTWRMPTREEYDELTSNCTWTWDSDNLGYTVKGKNGNSIFIPASGIINPDGPAYKNEQGQYWTSTYDISENHADDHWGMRCAFSKAYKGYTGGTYIYYGLPIRPVRP